MSDKATLISNINDKLVDLPEYFSDIMIDIDKCLNDAMREMRITDITTITDPTIELYLELRAEYYALTRIRNKVALNFKYSTGNEGKSVDKTEIFKAIDAIIDDLDSKFVKWYSNKAGHISSSWNRTAIMTEELTGYDE